MTDTGVTQNAAAQPIIDVLIPAYNAANTIRESIRCIQDQTLTDLRIIVVDDGSSDATGMILREIAANDARVLIHSQSNAGIVGALNAGLALCTAQFIARHDADDIAYLDRFARQLAYLEAHPDCVAVGANAWHIGSRGERLGTRTTFHGDVSPDATAIPAVEPYLMHPFLMMRRDALVGAGGYRYCFHAEDADLYWRLLGTGRLYNLEEILGEYRIHASSVSSASTRNGRVAAKYSQLAALSYLRRKRGEEDIRFEKHDLELLNNADSINSVIAFGSELLSSDELKHLTISVSAKLMELASYRPYVLEGVDCEQLSRNLTDLSDMPSSQRLLIRRSQAEVLRRYIDTARWRQIWALGFPPSVYLMLPRRYLWKIRNTLSVWRRRLKE